MNPPTATRMPAPEKTFFAGSQTPFAEKETTSVAIAATLALVMSQGKKHMKQQTISSLEACLNPKDFLRIHRSYVVNLQRVSKLEPYGKDSHVVTLTDGTRLPVSRSGYGRLRSLLDQ
jgi:DNA-binding LytR/AlgR family response regulator